MAVTGQVQLEEDLSYVRVHQLVDGVWVRLGTDITVTANGRRSPLALNAAGDTLIVGSQRGAEVFTLQAGDWVQLGLDIADTAGFAVDITDDGRTVIVGSPGRILGADQTGAADVFTFDDNAWTRVGGSIVAAGDDETGTAVEISADGSIVVVGEPGAGTGQARAFSLIGGEWQQLGSTISETSRRDFAEQVVLNSTGTTVVINRETNVSPTGTEMFVYDFVDGDWTQVGSPLVGGVSAPVVDLSDDGRTVAIGRSDIVTRSITQYELVDGAWTQIQQFRIDGIGPRPPFNWDGNKSSSMSGNGDVFAMRGDYGGTYTNNPITIHTFQDCTGRPTPTPTPVPTIIPTPTPEPAVTDDCYAPIGQTLAGLDIRFDEFGTNVAMSADGSVMMVANPLNPGVGDGYAQVFELRGNQWIQLGEDIPNLGTRGTSRVSIDVNASGNRVIMANPGRGSFEQLNGAAQVYEYQQGRWVPIGGPITGTDASLRAVDSVAMTADGNTVVVGSIRERMAEVFTWRNGSWEQVGSPITESGPYKTGASVSISADGQTVLVGEPDRDNGGGVLFRGKARVFSFVNGEWEQVGQTLRTPNSDLRFAEHTAMSDDGNTVLIRGEYAGQYVIPGDDSRFNTLSVYTLVDGVWQLLADPIFEEGSDAEDFEVAINSDGTRLLSVSNQGGVRVAAIYRLSEANGQWIKATEVGAGAVFFAFSPDGLTVSAASRQSPTASLVQTYRNCGDLAPGPFGSLTVAGGATAVNTSTVDVEVTAEAASVTEMRIATLDAIDTALWVPFDPAAQQLTLPTGDGEYVVAAQLRTADGNTSSALTYKIVVDTTPPVITINSLVSGAVLDLRAKAFEDVTGTANDASGIASVTGAIDGETGEAQLFASDWTLQLGSPDTEVHELRVTATDNAGNQSTEAVSFSVLPTDASELIIAPNVQVVDGDLAQTLDWDPDSGRITFERPFLPTPDQFKVGDIVVTGVTPSAPDGILQRIDDIGTSENFVVLRTSQASLADIFLQVSSLTDPAAPAARAAAGGSVPPPSDDDAGLLVPPIGDASSVNSPPQPAGAHPSCLNIPAQTALGTGVFPTAVAILQTSENFDANVNLCLEVQLRRTGFFSFESTLTYFEVSADLDASYSVEADFAFAGGLPNFEQGIAPAPIPNTRSGCDGRLIYDRLFVIGFVPIWITLNARCKLSVDLTSSGETVVSAAANAQGSIGGYYTPETGLEPFWTWDWDSSTANNSRSTVTGTMAVFAGLQVKLYGVNGPYVEAGAALDVVSESIEELDSSCITLQGRLLVEIAAASPYRRMGFEVLSAPSRQFSSDPAPLYESCPTPVEIEVGYAPTEAEATCAEPGTYTAPPEVEELFVKYCFTLPTLGVQNLLNGPVRITESESNATGSLLLAEFASVLEGGETVEVCCDRIPANLLVGEDGGTFTDRVTVTSESVAGGPALTQFVEHEVTIPGQARIEVLAVPRANGGACPGDYSAAEPGLEVEPGDSYTMTYCVKNVGTVPVEVVSQVSTLTGDIAGVVLAPGEETSAEQQGPAPLSRSNAEFDTFTVTYRSVDSTQAPRTATSDAAIALRASSEFPYDNTYAGDIENNYPGLNSSNPPTNYGENGSWWSIGGAGNDWLWTTDGADNDETRGDEGYDNIFGGGGNDLLTGNAGKDIVQGGFGNDDVDGGTEDDVVSGGADSDVVFGRGNNDVVGGGSGDDYLSGGEGNDYLSTGENYAVETVANGYGDIWAEPDGTFTDSSWGFTFEYSSEGYPDYVQFNQIGTDGSTVFDGTDAAFGGEGTDVIEGDDGKDLLSGGSDNDSLVGKGEDDTILGGSGADLVDGGDGNDRLFGGPGTDRIQGGAGDDYISVGSEASVDEDRVLAGAGDDEIRGNAGIDRIQGNSGADLIFGGAGDDVLDGNGNIEVDELPDSDDVIFGGEGDDNIEGGAGDDILSGGSGIDQVLGEEGNDEISGGDGVDTLAGGDDNDFISGQDGDDQLQGNGGSDRILGGAGNDVIFGYGNDELNATPDELDYLFGGTGNDDLVGGGGNDLLFGGRGDDNLFGEDDDDQLRGGRGTDSLVGGEGVDKLFGDEGVDTLSGEAGDDELDGGEGDDVLGGGAGNDTYFIGLNEGNDSYIDAEGANRIVFGVGITLDAITITSDTTPAGEELVEIDLPGLGSLIMTAADFAAIVAFEFADGSTVNPAAL